jgi:hypothetical protein
LRAAASQGWRRPARAEWHARAGCSSATDRGGLRLKMVECIVRNTGAAAALAWGASTSRGCERCGEPSAARGKTSGIGGLV